MNNTSNTSNPMKRKLEVSRRKIAAVAFLSNIKVSGEADHDVPGYNCLLDTQVLDDFRKSRCRRKIAKKGAKKKEKEAVNGNRSREKTPEVDSAKKVGSFRRQGEKVHGRTRRQLVYTNQLSAEDAIDPCRKVATSMESILGHGDARVRQISGTLSDQSQNSNKEVIFVKSDDQTKVVDERMVFISYSKLPFSVSSTIPYNKHSKVAPRYNNSLVLDRNFSLAFIATTAMSDQDLVPVL